MFFILAPFSTATHAGIPLKFRDVVTESGVAPPER
jgi:hypothetical protein